jgi:hypothetical protein
MGRVGISVSMLNPDFVFPALIKTLSLFGTREEQQVEAAVDAVPGQTFHTIYGLGASALK